jgi:hypothetical protein
MTRSTIENPPARWRRSGQESIEMLHLQVPQPWNLPLPKCWQCNNEADDLHPALGAPVQLAEMASPSCDLSRSARSLGKPQRQRSCAATAVIRPIDAGGT